MGTNNKDDMRWRPEPDPRATREDVFELAQSTMLAETGHLTSQQAATLGDAYLERNDEVSWLKDDIKGLQVEIAAQRQTIVSQGRDLAWFAEEHAKVCRELAAERFAADQLRKQLELNQAFDRANGTVADLVGEQRMRDACFGMDDLIQTMPSVDEFDNAPTLVNVEA